MIPGLGLYFILVLLFSGIKAHIVHFCCIMATFIPSVMLLAWQFISNFYRSTELYKSEGEGIGFSFGAFLSIFSDNLFVSLMLALTFPLFVLVVDAKRLLKDISVSGRL